MSAHHARHRAEPARTASRPGTLVTPLARAGRRAAVAVVVSAAVGAATLGLAAPVQAQWLLTGPGSPSTQPSTQPSTPPSTPAAPARGGAWPVPDSGIRTTLPTTLGPVTTWRTPTAAVATGNAAALRNGIVATAKTGAGRPYVWGGTSPVTGWDCGGYVSWVLRQYGFDLPVLGGDAMAAALGAQQIPLSEGRPGDIIWIPGQHIGIYDGNGGVFEALNPVQGTMYNPYHGGLLIRLPVRDS